MRSDKREPGDRSMSERVRIAAYALAIRDRHVLLIRVAPGNLSAGCWTLPGGGLDFGESPEDGMHRELREETGLTGAIGGLIGINSIVFKHAKKPSVQGIRIVYRVDCDGEPVTETNGSTDLARWIAVDDLGVTELVDLVGWALEQSQSD